MKKVTIVVFDDSIALDVTHMPDENNRWLDVLKPKLDTAVGKYSFNAGLERCNLLRRNGFTLTELLVVIAIISILASMLLPVLSRAKDATKGIVCLNNLKQFGVAFSSYNFDYNGYYPAYDPDHLWMLLLSPYIDNKYMAGQCGAWRCPLRPYLGGNGWKLTTYSFNRECEVYKDVQVKFSGSLYLLLESPWHSLATDRTIWDNTVVENGHGKIDLVHQRATNVLFADGHVQTVCPANRGVPLSLFPDSVGTDSYKKGWFCNGEAGRY
ncbi:MAG: type II secretion system protein [Victivallales bacterium]|jgi:prepilin-type N-terminal cleavage/methylation domain-containing protein/prepilin-type processing-associated H-X9-DG protein